MNAKATIANSLWAISNLPSWLAFRHALNNPAKAQNSLLRRIIAQATTSAFGQEHQFGQITNYRDFATKVPVRDYGDFEPWISRIKNGETNILSSEPVKRLATTSGTSGPQKLIPYTAGLQRDFNRAIGPWIVDLFRSYPSLMRGPAYWSISPVAQAATELSAVPIGFEEDSEYLGGVRRRFVDAVMAVPASVRHARSMDEWRQRTLHHLRSQDDLRLISVWHPSFLMLLMDHIHEAPEYLWPKLKVISCWADAHAASPAAALAKRFPQVAIQPKGVIATEGIISIPFAGRWPLAIRSHFVEFIDVHGSVYTVDELRAGEIYEPIITTSGGLYRYKLYDRVVVEAHVGRTTSIRFLGKSGNISDRFGEKLSETFVAQVLEIIQRVLETRWQFAMLAPEGNHYVLYIEGDAPGNLCSHLDAELRRNPQYSHCRDLGQLDQPRLFRIASGGHSTFIARIAAAGQRLGDIKPAALSTLDGWSQHFNEG